MEPSKPIFTPEEIYENEQKRAALIKLLLSGEGILMAGAGCSASIYPNWEKFIELLCEASRQKKEDFPAFNPQTDDLLSFAENVKKCIGDELYYSLIFRTFREKEKTHERFHEVLCRLLVRNRLKGITTTNYDLVLENALVAVTRKRAFPIYINSSIEPARIFEFLLSLNGGLIPQRIFHIHGVCDQPDSIILSQLEYEEKYGFKQRKPPNTIFEAVREGTMNENEFSDLLNSYGFIWTRHYKILWSLFATRRLIFLGFSLTDPYFNKMLEFVSKDLHTYGYEQHFFVLRISSLEEKERAKTRAKELKESYGIETILFEENKSNKGLENFIFEIERAVSDKVTLIKEDEIIQSKGGLEGDEELTKRLIQLSKRL